MSRWFAHALILAVSTGVFAQSSNEAVTSANFNAAGAAPGVSSLLNRRIPEISFEDYPLDQVVDWLQSYTQVNIVPRWQTLADAGVARDQPITLRARNLRVSQILWLIMQEAAGSDIKLAYRASGNLIVLSTADDLGREMLVRVYEVADLLARFPNFRDSPQVEVQNAAPGAGGGVFNTGGGNSEDTTDPQPANNLGGQPDPDLQRLIDLIQRTIQPDSWGANLGLGTISAWRTQLIVRNNIRVHQELGGPVREGD